jgi:5-methylcytosine-specific restriction endonuclease McrA
MPKRAYDQPAYRAARKRLHGRPCHWCGRIADTVDHRIPIALGGNNDPENLVPACRGCNSSRGARLGHRLRRGRRFRWRFG